MAWIHACVLGTLLLAVGSATSDVLAQPAQKPQAATATATTQKDIEIAVLKGQLEVMRQYDQRLINTVYWSLGGLVTIAAILIGFGWFANFRVYERDRTALREALENDIRTALTKVGTELRSEILSERAEATRQVVERAKAEVERLRSEVDTQVRSLEMRFAHNDLLLHQRSAEEWSEKKVLSNAVRSQTDALKASLTLRHDYWIGRALDKMHEYLRAMKQGSGRLEADLLRQVENTLGSVPEEHAIAVAAVRSLMAAIRSE